MKRRLLVGLGLSALLVVVALVAVAFTLQGRQPSQAAICQSSDLTEVDVYISDHRINPGFPTFSTGICYHFVIKNTGSKTYDFVIRPKMPGSADLLRVSSIAPGQTQTINYEFDSPTGTTLQFLATQPGQAQPTIKYPILISK